VALLPGSRKNELDRTVPVMAEAIPLIRARVPDAQFVVACAPGMADSLFAPLVADDLDAEVVLVRERTDDVLAASDVVITASGTATIQSTLHEKPMVVVYRLSPLTYRLVKPFGHVDMYAMPNLVAGKRIVPELIQSDFTAERTADEALKFLTDRDQYERTRQALALVRAQLGQPGASARAAQAVLEVAHGSLSARGSND
jgi:lipid-A-disaccharide synthase